MASTSASPPATGDVVCTAYGVGVIVAAPKQQAEAGDETGFYQVLIWRIPGRSIGSSSMAYLQPSAVRWGPGRMLNGRWMTAAARERGRKKDSKRKKKRLAFAVLVVLIFACLLICLPHHTACSYPFICCCNLTNCVSFHLSTVSDLRVAPGCTWNDHRMRR